MSLFVVFLIHALMLQIGLAEDRVTNRSSLFFEYINKRLQDNPFAPSSASLNKCIQSKFIDNKTELYDYPTTEVERVILDMGLTLNKSDNCNSLFKEKVNEINDKRPCMYLDPVPIKPFAAYNEDGNCYFVINNEVGGIQCIKTDICALNNDGNTMDDTCMGVDYIDSGYTAKCKQTYFYRELLVFEHDGTLAYKRFLIPAACLCVIVKG